MATSRLVQKPCSHYNLTFTGLWVLPYCACQSICNDGLDCHWIYSPNEHNTDIDQHYCHHLVTLYSTTVNGSQFHNCTITKKQLIPGFTLTCKSPDGLNTYLDLCQTRVSWNQGNHCLPRRQIHNLLQPVSRKKYHVSVTFPLIFHGRIGLNTF